MAPFGHATSHALHSKHASGLTTAAFLSFMAKTLAGQTSTQAPQPSQSLAFICGGIHPPLDFCFTRAVIYPATLFLSGLLGMLTSLSRARRFCSKSVEKRSGYRSNNCSAARFMNVWRTLPILSPPSAGLLRCPRIKAFCVGGSSKRATFKQCRRVVFN